MSKFGLEYGEVNTLRSKIGKCIENLESQKRAADKALSSLSEISEGYSELKEIAFNLNAVKLISVKEVEKVSLFKNALNSYTENIRNNDTQVYTMKEK
ncbi:hypothetical protein [Clostridium gasigenes]|uniref:Uncharacterized protein n=1 Tax=Clostridium gasigenes TaxID=94869 RepID=A0A7X0SF96_9CLOT|nr:hypothetical protein [Clostridium gasigenes]MBB6716529.1 hypothetical protein [Clostridium gasigenes]